MNWNFLHGVGLSVHHIRRLCNKQDLWWVVFSSHPERTCWHPGDISGGTVVSTASWKFDSYAIYRCNSPKLSLVGYSYRKCRGTKTSVRWEGMAPQCRGKLVRWAQNFCFDSHKISFRCIITENVRFHHLLNLERVIQTSKFLRVCWPQWLSQ